MTSYGKGAQLEGTALEWLQDVRTLENRSIKRTGAILAVSANEMLGRLEGSYKRLVDSKGTDYRYTAQQQAARLNAIAEKAGDFINPATRKQIIDLQMQDLQRAQTMGMREGVDLQKIISDRSKTLNQNAKPNVPAIEQAGKRLNDFWAKENTSFRDRVRALTQVAAAQGVSYRKLANQVRELLVLEQQQGTESKRSQRINKKLGVQARAELIARTEIQTAYVHGQISKHRQNGFDWGRWSAAGERTCGFCISRHGMIYDLEEIEGQIPAHPRCRCTVIPVEAPEGWQKGDKIDPSNAELDDEFWTKARKKQIDEWKRDQNTRRDGTRRPPDQLKSNSELDQAIRRYLNTPTNTQQFLMPGTDAPPPLWKPSGNTIPDPGAAAATAAAGAAAQAKPGAPKVDVDIIPDEIIDAGLEPAWKQMANDPDMRAKLLQKVKDMKAKAAADAKAQAKKEAEAQKKKDAEIKAAKAKKDAIDGLQKLGVSKEGAEQVWRLTQKYRAEGMSPEAATTKAIQDMAAGKLKTGELVKPITERVMKKQLIQEKGNGKLTQQGIGEAFAIASAAPGLAGMHFNTLMKFAERYNIAGIWGTGGKGKSMPFVAQSKQLLSSMNAAHARKDGGSQYGYNTLGAMARMQLIDLQANNGIKHATPHLIAAVSVDGKFGVAGSTAKGYGFVKTKLDSKAKPIDRDTFEKIQKEVATKIEEAGKQFPSFHGAGAKVDKYWKKSGKYMIEHSDTSWLTTYVHEMGHQVHFMAGSPTFKGKYVPSKYGNTNREEWFAETFLQYTLAPEALKKHAPEAYKFVDKVVKTVMDPAAKPGHVNRWNSNGTVDPDKYFNAEQQSTAAKAKAPEPDYAAMNVKQLKAAAKAAGIKGYSKMKKAELQATLAP